MQIKIDHDLVIITIGNSELKMHYGDALYLSQMIRVWAKKAKDNEGDKSRHWSAMGVLDDLTGKK